MLIEPFSDWKGYLVSTFPIFHDLVEHADEPRYDQRFDIFFLHTKQWTCNEKAHFDNMIIIFHQVQKVKPQQIEQHLVVLLTLYYRHPYRYIVHEDLVQESYHRLNFHHIAQKSKQTAVELFFWL